MKTELLLQQATITQDNLTQMIQRLTATAPPQTNADGLEMESALDVLARQNFTSAMSLLQALRGGAGEQTVQPAPAYAEKVINPEPESGEPL